MRLHNIPRPPSASLSVMTRDRVAPKVTPVTTSDRVAPTEMSVHC
jgi:hypothetical protein